jgi:hypothetical protein
MGLKQVRGLRELLTLSQSKIDCKDKKLHQSIEFYFNQNSDANAREVH